MTLQIFRCAKCDAAVFPARYFCPTCGANDWRACDAQRGIVSAVTVVRHRLGRENNSDLHLASVKTDAGPIVIALIEEGAVGIGDAVGLRQDETNRILARRL